MFWTLMNFGAKGTEYCILAIVWGCFCFATVFLVGFLLLCNLCDVYYSSFHYIIICIIVIITCVSLCHLFIIILPVNRSGFIPDLVDLLLFSPASSNTICCMNTIIYCKYHHLLCDPQSTGLLASDLPPPPNAPQEREALEQQRRQEQRLLCVHREAFHGLHLRQLEDARRVWGPGVGCR